MKNVEVSHTQPQSPDEESGDQNEMVRLFVAIPLSDEVREQVAGLIGRLQTGFQFTPCRPSWCNPDSIHLTLAFLGKKPIEMVKDIQKSLSALTAEFSPLKIEVKQLGVFPDWHHPKILWAGLRDRSHQIELIHERVVHILQDYDYQSDGHSFKPHLTLARFKSLKGVSIAKELVQNHGQYKFGPFQAPEVILYQSQLDPAGAIHTPLCAITLGKKGRVNHPDDAS